MRTTAVYWLFPILFGLLATSIGGLVLRVSTASAHERDLSCERDGSVLRCVERSAEGQRVVSGPLETVRFARFRSSTGLVIGEQLIDDVDERTADRLRGLREGDSLQTTVARSRPIMGLLVGSLMTAMLSLLAADGLRVISRRRRPIVVDIDPGRIVVDGGATIERRAEEPVRVVCLRRSRGQVPTMGVLYGSNEDVLFEARALRALELEPAAASISEALASVPRG